MALSLVGCQALPCARAAGCCLVGSGHEVTGCGILRGPGASTGSLVDGVRIPKTLELLHMHWQVGPDPGVSARLLEGRVGFWSPAAEPGIPRAHFRSYGGGRGILTQLSVGSGCPKGCVHLLVGQGPAGPKLGSSLSSRTLVFLLMVSTP